jgi:hypothetical protein
MADPKSILEFTAEYGRNPLQSHLTFSSFAAYLQSLKHQIYS